MKTNWTDEWASAPTTRVVLAMRGEDGTRWLAMGFVSRDPDSGEVWAMTDDGSEYLVQTTTGDPVSGPGGEWPEAWCELAFPGE